MAKKPIQVRIDEKLKKRVEAIFDRFGLDTATAIRIFFKKVDLTGGIPFDLRHDAEAEAGSWQFPWTAQEIEKVYRESLDPKNLSRPYDMPEELGELIRDLRDGKCPRGSE
jgi:addiction module RelB/DinJ family antitoxin